MGKVIEILRCEVGSRAHGLSTPESDLDLKGVHIAYTRDFFAVGDEEKVKGSIGLSHSGDADAVSFEIGHFLNLAIQSNPSIYIFFGRASRS